MIFIRHDAPSIQPEQLKIEEQNRSFTPKALSKYSTSISTMRSTVENDDIAIENIGEKNVEKVNVGSENIANGNIGNEDTKDKSNGNEGIATRMALDATVLAEIPLFDCPLNLTNHGSSAWAYSYRIDVENEDQMESYFMKVSFGDHGREALKGEFESTSAIHAVVGDFTPKPGGWGSFKGLPGAHYYFCRFYELAEHLPEPEEFCKNVATLHAKSESPNGKFGFHVVTYNGDLPQNNTYTDSWEEFFSNGFKHMIDLNIERGGPWDELRGLDIAMITKVIPRLLRPMETGGRSIKPSLVHGDLWCGNTAVDTATDLPLIYDPASFFAHNEYELGNWRPARNKFSGSHTRAYLSHIPETFPMDDYDDRNALYSMRFNLQAAALFPNVTRLRESVIEEMKRLVEKFPGGYEEYARNAI